MPRRNDTASEGKRGIYIYIHTDKHYENITIVEVSTKYKRNIKQKNIKLPHMRNFTEEVILDLTHNVELKVAVRNRYRRKRIQVR